MEKNEMAQQSVDSVDSVDSFDTAMYTLWFGLNYGSILTAFALYKTLEELGKKPVLLPKPKNLWTEHYDDKNNIAGLFIYENCNVLKYNKYSQAFLSSPETTHIVGSDPVWDKNLVGKFKEYFMLKNVNNEQRKVCYGSSFGDSFTFHGKIDNEVYHLLKSFEDILVANNYNADKINEYFNLDAKAVLDPVFLCNKQEYIKCAEKSAAKQNEIYDSFIFASIENGDNRKREFVIKGNDILIHNKGSLLRCMIDINRFPESKEALGMDPAYFIRVEDYLYYLINSEFVLTDNIYAMYLAVIFEKPFIVLINKDSNVLYKYKDFLEPLGLDERIVYVQDDFKSKEYLFRKPINYEKVNKSLTEIKQYSLNSLINALDIKVTENDDETAEREEN